MIEIGVVKKVGLINGLMCGYDYTLKEDPSSLYVTFKTLLVPQYKEDFKKSVMSASDSIKRRVYSLLGESKQFSRKFIVDCSTAYGKMKVGKKSFATVEVYLHRTDGKADDGSVRTLARLMANEIRDVFMGNGFDIEPKKTWK